MKVLFVSEYYPPKIMGGGEINLELLATALAKKKVGVFVLTSHHAGLEKKELKNGVTIYRRLKTGRTPSGMVENVKRSLVFPKSVIEKAGIIIKEQKIDLIHFIGTSIIVAEELKQFQIPLFATIESYPTLCPKGDRIFHAKTECKIQCSFTKFLSCQAESPEIGKMKNGWYLKYNPPALSYIYNYYSQLNEALKHCNLISISSYVQSLLKQQGYESIVIPNALDAEKFSTTIKNEPRKNEKIRILYLGSLIQSKGAQILAEAVQGVDCQVDMYGEGVLKEELQQKIEQKNLPITIHPPVPYAEIPSLYWQADIVVFPSLWPEPFGRIAIEAMAAGKPVIASAIGGIKETIAEGTGILVDPGNVQQLREAIILLMHDQELRKEMGKKGRKIVEKLYAEEKVVEKLMEVYGEQKHPLKKN
ncbi:glycosyltransferase family 4 protein [Candidatus Woesearchaeota archaeon]|nr:glycosyltransferase family 4 protein [Candidatus Woesearchaeota archaeon]